MQIRPLGVINIYLHIHTHVHIYVCVFYLLFLNAAFLHLCFVSLCFSWKRLMARPSMTEFKNSQV